MPVMASISRKPELRYLATRSALAHSGNPAQPPKTAAATLTAAHELAVSTRATAPATHPRNAPTRQNRRLRADFLLMRSGGCGAQYSLQVGFHGLQLRTPVV